MKNYTETFTFQSELNELRKKGAPEKSIKKHTKIMGQFDENGCEIGTDYANVVLAYLHFVP